MYILYTHTCIHISWRVSFRKWTLQFVADFQKETCKTRQCDTFCCSMFQCFVAGHRAPHGCLPLCDRSHVSMSTTVFDTSHWKSTQNPHSAARNSDSLIFISWVSFSVECVVRQKLLGKRAWIQALSRIFPRVCYRNGQITSSICGKMGEREGWAGGERKSRREKAKGE